MCSAAPALLIKMQCGRKSCLYYHLTSENTKAQQSCCFAKVTQLFIKDGTGTYYSTISSLSFSGTEGGDQFDLSSLDVRTMFLFLKEYFKLFNSDLPLRQVLYSSASEL